MPHPLPTEAEPGRRAERLPDRVRLVVLFGGRSAEHDISCISASHVLAAADPGRYEVVPIGITREGRFVEARPDGQLAASGPGTSLQEVLGPHAGSPGAVGVDRGDGNGDGERRVMPTPTVVLPVLHGPNGEDGTIQGMLEVLDTPYVGAGVLASAVAMDKDMAKTVMHAKGIPQTRWRTLCRHRRPSPSELGTLLEELGPIVYVKPANMGSSIGVTRVDSASAGADHVDGTTGDAGVNALGAALDEALRYDDVVVVEAGVQGRELECAVLGNDAPQASVLGEVLTDAEFYDYGDKYFNGTARTAIPAELDEATMRTGRELAVRTFEALRCSGMARVDMFLTDGGEFLVNEVNTIPGFTPISMYPKLWEASGLPYGALVDELVALALESHGRRSAHSTVPGDAH